MTTDPRAQRLILDYAQQPPRFRCLHCGDEHWVMLPLPISELVSRADEFVARHSRCRQGVAV
ncbi:MAG: hypothetical protein VKO65_01775 [Cyanobacteriota bacterium]|nr:hypothetical protein [Cyanobacteriota bacterium]